MPTSLYCCLSVWLHGIILVALLILLNLTVSVGTVNGLIFLCKHSQNKRKLFLSSRPCSSAESVHLLDKSGSWD